MTTPVPWMHEFGVSRLEDHLQGQEADEPVDVLCPSCNLYRNRYLPTCPSCPN